MTLDRLWTVLPLHRPRAPASTPALSVIARPPTPGSRDRLLPAGALLGPALCRLLSAAQATLALARLAAALPTPSTPGTAGQVRPPGTAAVLAGVHSRWPEACPHFPPPAPLPPAQPAPGHHAPGPASPARPLGHGRARTARPSLTAPPEASSRAAGAAGAGEEVAGRQACVPRGGCLSLTTLRGATLHPGTAGTFPVSLSKSGPTPQRRTERARSLRPRPQLLLAPARSPRQNPC